MKLKDIKTGINDLEDIVKTQSSDGSWNYDNYMHGLANGLILALSLIKNEKPEFLEAPEKWLGKKNKK